MEKIVIESNSEIICRIAVDSSDFLNSQAQSQIKQGYAFENVEKLLNFGFVQKQIYSAWKWILSKKSDNSENVCFNLQITRHYKALNNCYFKFHKLQPWFEPSWRVYPAMTGFFRYSCWKSKSSSFIGWFSEKTQISKKDTSIDAENLSIFFLRFKNLNWRVFVLNLRLFRK